MQRIDGPDILRGFAAFGIMIFHVAQSSGVEFNRAIINITDSFCYFVPMFFVISAFSISYSSGHLIYSKNELMAFYIRRFFRLAPLFYLLLLGRYIGIALLFPEKLPSFSDILLSLTFLFPFLPGYHEGIVAAGWSVGVEWIFYAVFPLMFCLISNLKRAMIVWFICVLVSAKISTLVDPPTMPGLYFHGFLFNLIFFVIGIGVFRVLERFNNKPVGHLLVFFSLAIIIGFIVIAHHFYIDANLIYSLAWTFLIVLSLFQLPPIFNNRFTRYLGRISYSIYLLHPVIVSTLKRLGIYGHLTTLAGNGIMGFSISCLITAIIVLLVSVLTYKYVELPCMNYGKTYSLYKKQSA